MADHPARAHTRYGERQARLSVGAVKPLCEQGYGAVGLGQPDPGCDCPACVRRFR